MPKAGGLDDVVQKFLADNSDYVSKADENVQAALRMAKANDDASKSFGALEQTLIGVAAKLVNVTQGVGRDATWTNHFQMLGPVVSDMRDLTASVDSYTLGLNKAMGQQEEWIRAQARARIEMAGQKELYNDIARVAQGSKNIQMAAEKELTTAVIAEYGKRKVAAEALAAETEKISVRANQIYERGSAALVGFQGSLRRAGASVLPDAVSATQLREFTEGSNAAVNAIADAAYSLRGGSGGGASAARAAGDLALARMIEGQRIANAPLANANMGDMLASAVAAKLFPGGGGGAATTGGLSAAVLAMMANEERPDRYSSIIPALLAGGAIATMASVISASPAVGAAVVNVARNAATAVGNAGRGAAVLGAYGLGMAGQGLIAAGGAISGGGAFEEGASGRAGTLVTNFLGTWLPRLHYAMMGINEVLATAGPAVVAAGAAGLVGLEGGQTMFDRVKAINNVGQSLGPALGQTPGQFLGLGDALQKAQTLADPAVWELMGGALRDVNAATDKASGGLGNFWQLGTNTIDMLDRFGAKVTTAFQGGAGKQLNDLVSQGTGDLQQFGDVLGNVGKTFLNIAPALPGVGGDLLSTLQAATKGVSVVTGALPVPLLGAFLAAEAGGRYGPGLVGSVGNLLGRAPGNILGTSARAATAADVAARTINPATGVAVAAEGEDIAGTGVAGALGGVGALDLAAAAAGAYLTGKVATAQSPTQQWVGRLQSKVNQDNFTQAFGDLASNIQQFGNIPGGGGGPQSLDFAGGYLQSLKELGKGDIFPSARDSLQALFSMFGGPGVRTQSGTMNAALTNASQQFNNLLSAGPAIQQLLGGGSIQNAYDIADMAGLQGSQLQQLISGTPTQKTDIRNQLLNEQRGYSVMAASPGVYGANVNAVQAMGGLQGTQLANVNAAWDQVLQNATTGTASATGFAGGLQNLQTLGGSLQAVQQAAEVAKLSPSAVKQSASSIAKALTSFSSPASQQAWAAFSSPSTTAPGLLQQVGTMTDFLRTAMTVSGGTVGQGQFNQATGYELKQILPYAKQSPAALAQLGVLSQQMGGPAYNPNLSQAKNYEDISRAVDKAAGSTAQYNKVQNEAAIATAGVSQQALQFGATMKTNVYSALSGGATGLPQVSADAQKFKDVAAKMASAGPGGGAINTGAFKSAAQSIAGDLASVGASAKDTGVIIGQMLAGKGLNTAQMAAAIATVQGDMSKIQSKNVKISATANLAPIKAFQDALNSLKNKNVTVLAIANRQPVLALSAAISGVVNKTVTVTTRVVTQYINSVESTFPNIPRSAAIGVSPAYLLSHGQAGGLVSSAGRIGHQAGYLVPGFGGGDVYPAMLEPGEAVIPKYLVHQIAPFLKAHGIPGFAAGGVVPGSSLSQINSQISGAWNTLDSLYAREKGATGNMLASLKQQVNNFWSTVLDPLYAAKDALHGTTTSATNTAAAAKAATTATDKLATTIANKFTTAMNFARGVSGAASAGQGFGTTGLISGMDPTQDTVANQMQTYLTSEKAFTKDLKTLTKGGLNKSLIQQLIAAGPTQGDALAQSILQGGGTSGTGAGISQVNQLWKQIGSASHALGSQAAMSIYGQTIAPNLKSGNVTSNNISINVSVPGGAGANLNLTTAQIKQITEEVQAALLKQAKRNRTTGVALAGKKA